MHAAAFDTETEAKLVDALRDAGAHRVSLVATFNDEIAGHILFTPVTFENGADEGDLIGLAPMAVLPEQQRRGIGSQLVRAGIETCREAGYKAVVVLGHAGYYPRFGFQPASAFGIQCAYDVPDEAFMALELVPGALKNLHGTVHYHLLFNKR